VVPSATIAGRSPVALGRTGARLGAGFVKAVALIRRLKPDAVVGFGGYPTLPPLFAARALGVPAIVHEANAVAGRANRLTARFAQVATSFPEVKGFSHLASAPVRTGLPVRQAVLAAAATPYEAPEPDGEMRLLVFGGSQGAHVFAELVPAALERLPEELRGRIRLVQQVRAEDLGTTRARIAALGVDADLAPFFADLPARMAAAHLVVARAGAATVAELATIGRPAILVPRAACVMARRTSNKARDAPSVPASRGIYFMTWKVSVRYNPFLKRVRRLSPADPWHHDDEESFAAGWIANWG
jgi:UDP-N-acetylglucosamine--N-acetylmuramyl-(pentapeptide) pyrophosphoryl-undecaprenol N-acetylglucosamine transferase